MSSGIPHDAPFLYKFSSTPDRVYGPRPLWQVVTYYAQRAECFCVPAGVESAPWRLVSAVAAEMLPEPASERQLKRLKSLGVEISQNLSSDQAKTLIQEADAKLPATPAQLKKLATKDLSVTTGMTRGDVNALLDDAERSTAIRELRRRQIEIPDTAAWDDIDRATELADDRAAADVIVKRLRQEGLQPPKNLSSEDATEWEYAWKDLQIAISEAKRDLGVEFSFPHPSQLRLETMRQLGDAILQTVEAAARWESGIDFLVGRVPGVRRAPNRSERRAAVHALFERVRDGSWRGDSADDEWLIRQALGT